MYVCVCVFASNSCGTLQRCGANKNAPGKWCSINICVALLGNGLVCEFLKIPSFQWAILVFSQCTDSRVASGFFKPTERTYKLFFVETAFHMCTYAYMCACVRKPHVPRWWMPLTKVTVDWLCHCCWFFDFCCCNYLSHFSFLQLMPPLLFHCCCCCSSPMLSNKAACS